MGLESDEMAVVDESLKVHGVNNLRVVDASVFPAITNGNLYAPTIMVAEKAADMIMGHTLAPEKDAEYYRYLPDTTSAPEQEAELV